MNTVIPDDCAGILSGAFNNHQKLSSLTFPKTLKYIGLNNTFNGDISLNEINYLGTVNEWKANVGTKNYNTVTNYYNDGNTFIEDGLNTDGWIYFDFNTFTQTKYDYWLPWIEFMVPYTKVHCTDGDINK